MITLTPHGVSIADWTHSLIPSPQCSVADLVQIIIPLTKYTVDIKDLTHTAMSNTEPSFGDNGVVEIVVLPT